MQKIFGLATTFVLVRIFTQETYGEYNFVISILGLLTVTALPSIDDAVMQSVARKFLGTYNASLKIKFLSSLLGTLALILLSALYYFQTNFDLSIAFIVASFLFPFAYGLTQWRGFFLGIRKFKHLNFFESLAAIIVSAAIISSVLLIKSSIFIAIGALLLVKSMQNIFISIKIYNDNKTIELKVEEGSIKYGLKTSIVSLASQLSMTIDKILLFTFISPASLAIYSVSEKLPELVKGLVKNLATALAPRFAKQKEYTKKIDFYLKVISLLLFLSLIVFSFTLLPFFITLIFGEQYESAIPYSQAMMCIVAVANMAPLKGRFFKSKLDEKSMRDFLLYTSLVRIISSVCLVPFFGLHGAIASYFIGRVTTNMAVHIIMNKRYPVKA